MRSSAGPLSWPVPEGTTEAHCVCQGCGTHFLGAIAKCPRCGSHRAEVVQPPDKWLDRVLGSR